MDYKYKNIETFLLQKKNKFKHVFRHHVRKSLVLIKSGMLKTKIKEFEIRCTAFGKTVFVFSSELMSVDWSVSLNRYSD